MNDPSERRSPFTKGPSTKDVMTMYRRRDKNHQTANTELQESVNTGKIKATFLLPVKLHQRLKLFAVRSGQKFSAAV